MTDLDIRVALERATTEVTTPPDLLDRVRVGGRRRLVRRRVLLTAALGAAAAGSAGVLLRRPGHSGIPLYDRPARGNLSGDAAYLAKVRAAWLAQPDPGVDPHVIWAGLRPDGIPLAAVAARVDESAFSHAGVGPSGYGRFGFVDGTAVISMQNLFPGTDIAPALVLGAEHNLLFVLDDGRRYDLSRDWSYAADGRIRRQFDAIGFDADGAAIVSLSPQTDRMRFALRADGDRTVKLAYFDDNGHDKVLETHWAAGLERTLPGWERAWPTAAAPPVADRGRWDVTNLPGYDDPYGYHLSVDAGTWYIRGVTPDGRPFVVQTVSLDNGPELLFLIMERETYLGQMPRSTPVIVRLPDGQGVVLARSGAEIAYRVRSGTWLPAGSDVALVPAAATDARFTSGNGGPAYATIG